ncbi:MAG TPA: hypothetical protein VNQ76_20830 [Planctomicrobium sp.]|nr:hypothetical protein [Planctomicrobium sp.]
MPPALKIPGKVRLVKDCLKVGRWLTGHDLSGNPEYWNVTIPLLDCLVSNFNSQFTAGHYHPLQWGHGSSVIGESPQAGIDLIRQLWRDGETLYAGVYVSPDVARNLTAMNRQVSVRVVPSWGTQAGESWSDSLIHIAVVDHAAVPGQKPFMQLSARSRQPRTVSIPNQRPFRSLAAKVNTMDLQKLATLTNRLLNQIQPGLKIPDVATSSPESFLIALSLATDILVGTENGQQQAVVNDLSARYRQPARRVTSMTEQQANARARKLLGLD